MIRWFRHISRKIQDSEVTSAASQVLYALYRAPSPMTLHELSAKTDYNWKTIAKAVKRLLQHELIGRLGAHHYALSEGGWRHIKSRGIPVYRKAA